MMNHVITIGDMVEVSAAVVAIVIVLGGLFWLLAAFGRGMSQ